jgi:peptidyl-prolyl cis-trans isomerase SurA
MKRSFLILILLLMISSTAYPEIINGIACKVGSEIITIQDFETAYHQEKIRSVYTGEPVPDKKSVMNALVDNLIVEIETEKMGIVVTEDELDNIVQSIIDQNNMTMEEFVDELESEDLSLEMVRNNYRNDVLKMRLIHQITTEKVDLVTDEEARNFYNAPANKKLFRDPGIVELSRIFIPVPKDISYKEAKEIKNQALEISKRASGGEDFGELIASFSGTPETDGKSGYLGTFTKEQLLNIMSPEGAEMIFSLESGDVTVPMMIGDGYYIYKIEKKKDEKLLTYEEAYESITSYLMKQKGEELFREWLTEKRQLVSIHYVIELE